MGKANVSEDIKYIGVDDKTIDLFESQYEVPNGVSYNSYVILDEKITIMDTVDKRATEGWFNNLNAILGDKKPYYLVISHLEPDHASNIEKLANKYTDMKLIGNAKTFQMLGQFFDVDAMNLEDRKVVVTEGEEISLGKHSLQFFMAPMVHWPEVMVSYEKTDKVLFSADGFGKFGTLDTDEDWACEARRYYFNIVGKYGMQVQTLLKKAAALDINIIAPLHGPVLKSDLAYYIDKYDLWSSYKPEAKGVLIAYASIHGNTGNAARQLEKLLLESGEEKVEVMDLSRCMLSEAVENAFYYDRVVVAASTYDAGIFPVMEDFLLHLKAKNYQNRKVGIMENGSWAAASGKKMKAILEEMKNITICENMVSIKSTANEKNMEEMKALVEELRA